MSDLFVPGGSGGLLVEDARCRTDSSIFISEAQFRRMESGAALAYRLPSCIRNLCPSPSRRRRKRPTRKPAAAVSLNSATGEPPSKLAPVVICHCHHLSFRR